MAFVQKIRLATGAVRTHGVIGEVEGRSPIVIDDMLSTGATIAAAAEALAAAGARPPILVAVTHPLLVDGACERLRALPVARAIAADSIELPAAEAPLEIVSVAPLLAAAVLRHHRDRSLERLRALA
jgi:ribose-phosphate pyrophosphokinase